VALLGLVLASTLVPAGTARAATWCHRVARGESLAALAARYRTGVPALASLNALRPGVPLAPGRVLLLPQVTRLRRGELRLAPASLRADAAHLRRENRAADRLRFSRMRDPAMVRRFVRAGLLVPVPREAPAYRVAGVPAPLRVVRPWTRRFIEDLGAAAHALFDVRLRVTSLTRTVAAQDALARRNDNAAPARGPRRSSHLTGATVDISKRPHSAAELEWLRAVLGRLERARVLLAIEEVVQPHFHVMVFPGYAAYARAVGSPEAVGGC
jgi:LysM repeat protein